VEVWALPAGAENYSKYRRNMGRPVDSSCFRNSGSAVDSKCPHNKTPHFAAFACTNGLLARTAPPAGVGIILINASLVRITATAARIEWIWNAAHLRAACCGCANAYPNQGCRITGFDHSALKRRDVWQSFI
jgi:hypothetical protein